MKGTLNRNKQKLYYSLLLGKTPIYETDDEGNTKYYEDSEGNRYPLETGEKKDVYSTPIPFQANIALSGGDAVPVEYGLSVDSYAAVILTQKGQVPLVEGDLIWHISEPKYEYGREEVEITVGGKTMVTTAPIRESADYMVVKCSPSINVDKYILSAINK